MKTKYLILSLLILFTSCNKIRENEVVKIDLDDTISSINYSAFVESLEYVDLHLTDSLPINGVERVYVDGNKIFIKDTGREGILIFDKETGRLLRRVNYFGSGPEEFQVIGAFCLDTYHQQICIFDKGDMKIKMYDYDGKYVSSYKCSMFFVDMAKLGENSMTYFYPIYAEGESYKGIWTSDSTDRLLKQLDEHVTPDCRFHYFPMLYNGDNKGVTYYDRNWDELSVVSADCMQKKMQFEVVQKIPMDMMGIRNISPEMLDGHSIMHVFACSDHHLLLAYHTFDKDDMGKKNITWCLVNPENGETIISQHLENDLDSTVIPYNSLFYMDNNTWVRVDDAEDYTIKLQILHLK